MLLLHQHIAYPPDGVVRGAFVFPPLERKARYRYDLRLRYLDICFFSLLVRLSYAPLLHLSRKESLDVSEAFSVVNGSTPRIERILPPASIPADFSKNIISCFGHDEPSIGFGSGAALMAPCRQPATEFFEIALNHFLDYTKGPSPLRSWGRTPP